MWNIDKNAEMLKQDRRQIESLIKKMNIDAMSVSYGPDFGGPCCNKAFLVKGREMIVGHRRFWIEGVICRDDLTPTLCSSDSLYVQGRWRGSMTDFRKQEAWIVEDGDWNMSVQADLDVAYEDIVKIVLAIRKRELIDRLPARSIYEDDYENPEIDSDEFHRQLTHRALNQNPEQITMIRRCDSGFEVTTDDGGGGLMLLVRIVDSAVEILDFRMWIS